jgi:hypothetical protein
MRAGLRCYRLSHLAEASPHQFVYPRDLCDKGPGRGRFAGRTS